MPDPTGATATDAPGWTQADLHDLRTAAALWIDKPNVWAVRALPDMIEKIESLQILVDQLRKVVERRDEQIRQYAGPEPHDG